MVSGPGFKIRLLCAWIALTAVAQLHAAALFEDDSPLQIELSGPMGTLIAGGEQDTELPFRLRVDNHQLEIQVKPRGKSRLRVCDFPPLRLNFEGANTTGTPFEGQEKLKLVVRCRKNERSAQDVLEEYAAYRIFELLSAVSYRVRLVHITYNDTDQRIDQKYRESYGFLIEPLAQVAARAGGEVSKIPAVSLQRLEARQAALVYVFQYLVGNTDWSFVAPADSEICCHNIHLIGIQDRQVVVPYDFDLTGLVNASYAFPDPSLRIKSVTSRVYRGFCTGTEVLRGAIETVTSRQAEILNVISSLPIDSDKASAGRIDYLLKFFKEAGDEDKIIAKFEKSCHP
jgi:hypothetical protein